MNFFICTLGLYFVLLLYCPASFPPIFWSIPLLITPYITFPATALFIVPDIPPIGGGGGGGIPPIGGGGGGPPDGAAGSAEPDACTPGGGGGGSPPVGAGGSPPFGAGGSPPLLILGEGDAAAYFKL